MKPEVGLGECSHPFCELDNLPWEQDWDLGPKSEPHENDEQWWREDQEGSDFDDELEMEADDTCLADQAPGELEELLSEDGKLLVEHLRRTEALMKGIGSSQGNPFELVVDNKGRSRVFKSQLGKEFLRVVNKGCCRLCGQLPVIDQNPYVGVYHRVVRRWHVELLTITCCGVLEGGVAQTVSMMNQLMEDIRKELGRTEIKGFSQRADKAAKRRRRTALKIIDRCFEQSSRLMVLRVDLGYRKGKFLESDDFSQDLAMVKNHWTMMSDGIKKGVVVPNVMDAFGKLEYGVLSGFHFHVVVIMKGANHREDVNYAKMVGEQWSRVVTEGEGRYFNCNRKKRQYKYLGIGVINYFEKEKIEALKGVVIDYVVKSDYYMSAISPSKKTFFQVSHSRGKKRSKLGRPRRYLSKG